MFAAFERSELAANLTPLLRQLNFWCECGISQYDNKKPEEFESEFGYFDATNLYPTSPFEGP